MSTPEKRNWEETQAISRIRKELEKKQEALKNSERSRIQLRKKVDELSKKHHQLREEFQATFDGINSDKDRLTKKLAEQSRVIDEFRKCEQLKIKKVQKYIKHFIESDENRCIDKEVIFEQNEKFKKFINEKLQVKQTELGIEEDKENWRRRYQQTLQDNYIFYKLIDRYIEQNNNKDKLISTLRKENKLLADKDLEIWNLKYELKENQNAPANNVVELDGTKTANGIEAQTNAKGNGQAIIELKRKVAKIQREAQSIKERLRKQEQSLLIGGKCEKSVGARLKGMIFKSKDFDEKIVELTGETRQLMILHEEFMKLSNSLVDRIKMLEKSPSKNDEQNKTNAQDNGRKRRTERNFFSRILRRKA